MDVYLLLARGGNLMMVPLYWDTRLPECADDGSPHGL
jgi:hypothetical protein